MILYKLKRITNMDKIDQAKLVNKFRKILDYKYTLW